MKNMNTYTNEGLLNAIQNPDPWATETVVASPECEPCVTHTLETHSGDYKIVISHTLADTDLGTDAILRWEERGDFGSTPEEFAIAVDSIPSLIKALRKAQRIVTGDQVNSENFIQAADLLGVSPAVLASAMEPALRIVTGLTK